MTEVQTELVVEATPESFDQDTFVAAFAAAAGVSVELVEVLPGVKVCAINFAKLPPNPPSPDNVTSVAAAAADVAVEKGAACGWCAAAEPSALPAACGHTLAAEALGKVAIVA